MGYDRNRNNYGDWDDERFRRRGGQPQGMGYAERDYGRHNREDDDRGFFERAGERVRSWIGDDDDRGQDQRENRDNRWSGREDRDRNRGYSGSDYNSSNEQYSHGDAGQDNAYGVGREGPADTWGGSGFGGREMGGRRFDRIDAGSTGTHGAHPMAAPYGAGGGMGGGAGGYGSSARSAAIMRQSGGGDQSGRFSGQPYGSQQSQHQHDPHYSQWRNQQIQALDRDYDEDRREHQSKFEQEFGSWRTKRQGQRSSMSKVTEHMEVFGSDGEKIGTVDGVKGDRIILTKNDENAGGAHHSIPCSWIETVEDRVTVNKTKQEAMKEWRNVEHNRALFEREDQGSDGPHVLDRSFSGTYSDGDR